VQKEFGVCDDWTAEDAYHGLLNAVARISARIFVGLPLWRDEEWIKATTHYMKDVVNGFKAISKYPFFIRPIVASFIPELRAISHARRRAGKAIGPTVATIMNSSRSQVNSLPYDSCDGDSVSPYGDDQGQPHIVDHATL
jgi:gliotoxin biosynthesis cytochrome P450 monooxygenase